MLGLTNYSQWDLAKGMRSCVTTADAGMKQKLVDLAKQRISNFAHVGVTEMLEESITSLAAILGLHMGGPAWQVTPRSRVCRAFPGGVASMKAKMQTWWVHRHLHTRMRTAASGQWQRRHEPVTTGQQSGI